MKTSAEEKLKEIDQRKKQATKKALIAGLVALLVTIAIYALLKFIYERSPSTILAIITILWQAVFIFGVPLIIGFRIYRKNK